MIGQIKTPWIRRAILVLVYPVLALLYSVLSVLASFVVAYEDIRDSWDGPAVRCAWDGTAP